MSESAKIAQMEKYCELVLRINEDKLLSTGKAARCYTRTFGCQQNTSDGERINGMLRAMGYVFCDDPEQADLALFNTCAVRENAEDRVFGNVGALKQAKQRNKGMLICLCGCMVQQEHISEKIHKSFPFVDILFGTGATHSFPELVYKRLSGHARQFETPDAADIVEGMPLLRGEGMKASVPIMYGCDNFCTYCVVPLVRGRERSREPQLILDEIRSAVSDGYREIMLLGQNVNSYGRGLPTEIDFAGLLREINAISGDFRIRFMTSHPRDCTHMLIDAIADCEKVCRHIHLPLQSGSDRILALMNRHYTVAQYLELVAYARQKIPGISFTSDIIVGFPGENAEDFAQTLALVKQLRYHSLFTFIYSKREGTGAALMDDPMPEQEKNDNFTRLIDTQREISGEIHRSMVNTRCRVLVEGVGKQGPDYVSGRTDQGVVAEFKGGGALIGQFCDIMITKSLGWAVIGEILQ